MTTPSVVGSFVSTRGGSNSWSQSQRVIDAFRKRDRLGVPPLSVEYAPILTCNATCPLCPYSNTRRRTLHEGKLMPMGMLSPEDDLHASTKETAFQVIKRARVAGAKGVLFTGGGEPTIWRPLQDALHYCAKLGLQTAIYTNGFELGMQEGLAAQLLAPSTNLVFCRVSINTASPHATKTHWGLEEPVIDLQLKALESLLGAREDLYKKGAALVPSVQVSTIVDRHTVGDLPEIFERVSGVFARFSACHADDDTMVVRPLIIHGRKEYSTADHKDEVIQGIIDEAAPGRRGHMAMTSAGVKLFLGFGLDRIAKGEFKTYRELLEAEYSGRLPSLATGMFLTVGPDATVYPSTEHNCDPKWAMGNLKEQPVDEIYRSDRRASVMERLDKENWGPAVSQPMPRTARLDRIAHAIETGAITNTMIEEIRELSLTSHRLLLD